MLLVIKVCVDENRETSDSLTDEQIKDFEMMYDFITKMGLEENPLPLDFETHTRMKIVKHFHPKLNNEIAWILILVSKNHRCQCQFSNCRTAC